MKLKLTLIISLSVLLLAGCTNSKSKSSGDLQWRGPNRDGIFNEKNLLDEWPAEGPELLWQYDSLGR